MEIPNFGKFLHEKSSEFSKQLFIHTQQTSDPFISKFRGFTCWQGMELGDLILAGIRRTCLHSRSFLVSITKVMDLPELKTLSTSARIMETIDTLVAAGALLKPKRGMVSLPEAEVASIRQMPNEEDDELALTDEGGHADKENMYKYKYKKSRASDAASTRKKKTPAGAIGPQPQDLAWHIASYGQSHELSYK